MSNSSFRNDRIDFGHWLNKETWTPQEVPLIVFSINPAGEHYAWVKDHCAWVKNLELRTPVFVSDYPFTSGCGMLRCHEINEIFSRCSYKTNLKTPDEWIQYLVDEGLLSDDRPFSHPLDDYLYSVNLSFKPSENANISKYYRELSKNAPWSFSDVVSILCYMKIDTPVVDLMPQSLYGSYLSKLSIGPKYAHDSVTTRLKNSVANKTIEYLEVDCHSHIERRFKPEDIIKWVIQNEYQFPSLLFEELCKRDPNMLERAGLKLVVSNNPGLGPERQCERWLKQLTKSAKQKSKTLYQSEAKKLFPGLGDNAFKRAWNKATEETDWNKAGRVPGKRN